MNKKTGLILLVMSVLLIPSAWSQRDSIVSYSDDLTVSVPASLGEDKCPGGVRGGALLPAGDTLRRWDFHLSMGASVMGNRRGSASAFAISPSVEFHPSQRLKVRASMTLLDSYSLYPHGYPLGVRHQRSMAPVRNASSAAAVSVAATYQVNDRLWVGASLLHTGGWLASAALVNPWLADVGPVALDATAFSAAMRYRVGKKSYLDVQFTVIDDRTGAFGPLYFGGPFGGFYGGYFDNHFGGTFYSPFSSYSFHGTLFDD